MQPLILALDIGTSSTRTALFESTGQRLLASTAQKAYELITRIDGTAELDPSILLDAVRDCLTKTLHYAKNEPSLSGRSIAGVGTSCFWHSLVGLDKQARPITPIITWADARCRQDAAQLRTEFPEVVVHERTGCMLRTSFWPAQLRRLNRVASDSFRQVHQWISPAEWVQHSLIGKSNCSFSMASGTGLLDPNTLQWDAPLLNACLISTNRLPKISDLPIETAGILAQEFPELKNVPWFPAIGDGAASNLGSGCTTPDRAAINVGTSAAMRVMQSGANAKAPFGLFCYRVDTERFLIGGAVSNAGNLRAWALRELQTPHSDELESLLAQRSGPDHGLTVLPFWTPERAPTWNEEIPGAILGLTPATTGLDILQAVTEATYHRLALIAEKLIHQTGTAPKFLVSGGIQHSQTAMQRLADVINYPVYANPEKEASIRGAAIFAIEKLGMPVTPLINTEAFSPRNSIAERYQLAREKQKALEETLERHCF